MSTWTTEVPERIGIFSRLMASMLFKSEAEVWGMAEGEESRADHYGVVISIARIPDQGDRFRVALANGPVVVVSFENREL